MEAVYAACLIVGILYALVSVVFGDWLSQAMDGVLDFLSLDGPSIFQPMTLVGGITIFGGAGLLLERYSGLGVWMIALFAVLIAIVGAIAVFFLYVKPMENSENSIAFTIASLAGSQGEVIVPIPESGYGEVLVRVGAGNTNQIAASYDRKPIPDGAKVVVVDVREGILYVSELNLTI
ncbi:tetraspanin family protein [Paenibacillus paeoniae]|uniref:Protease n=1 Tax=Paenibacillus paeoniae TaxID=2292705 RepID=A0A371PJG8_9BACL|nr:tetraspanin family protein [Paenibacillus paeoniae]REK76352.1 protease [Paenibacillus paeoniae]